MKSIGLDLDGTLYDWHTPVFNYFTLYKEFTGSYNDLWGTGKWVEEEETLKYLAEVDTLYSESMPKGDVMEFLNYLKDRFIIYYVTARPANVRLTTEQYLRRYDFPYQENLIFSSDKVSVARNLGLSYFIEDMPHHVVKLSAILPTIMIARPWNREIQNEYPTVARLMESIKYLEE